MIAGGWGDHWDVAWGSGAITDSRMKALYMTQPYYSTPANFFVAATSTVTDPKQLSGKTIGTCSGCTHELYLRRTLTLPGETLTWLVDNPTIQTYNNEPPGLADVAAGKLDAFLCSEPVGQAQIAAGVALKELATPAFFTQKTGYVDRSLTLAPGPFLDKINSIIEVAAGLREAEGPVAAVLQDGLRDTRGRLRSDRHQPDGSIDSTRRMGMDGVDA